MGGWVILLRQTGEDTSCLTPLPRMDIIRHVIVSTGPPGVARAAFRHVLADSAHRYCRPIRTTIRGDPHVPGETPLEGGKDMDGTTRRWPRILLAVIGKARTPAEGRSLGGRACAVLVATLTAAVVVLPAIGTPAAHAPLPHPASLPTSPPPPQLPPPTTPNPPPPHL